MKHLCIHEISQNSTQLAHHSSSDFGEALRKNLIFVLYNTSQCTNTPKSLKHDSYLCPVYFLIGKNNLTEVLMKCFPQSLKWKENKILWCFYNRVTLIWFRQEISWRYVQSEKIREGKNQSDSSFNSLLHKTIKRRKKIDIQWMSFFKWQTKPVKYLFW